MLEWLEALAYQRGRAQARGLMPIAVSPHQERTAAPCSICFPPCTQKPFALLAPEEIDCAFHVGLGVWLM